MVDSAEQDLLDCRSLEATLYLETYVAEQPFLCDCTLRSRHRFTTEDRRL